MHFSGALIALDTNVLMGKLPVIKSLCFLIEDINMGLFLPCTVMRELDCLKVKKPSARAAILFIEQENARENCKIFIEHAVTEKGSTNDDSIVFSCQKNNISLLISDDTALRLKANNAGNGLHSISVENKTAKDLLLEITELFQMHFMECEMKDDFVGTAKKVTAQIAFTIYHRRILPIVERELGADMMHFYVPCDIDCSLSSLLRYVGKNNHHLFGRYFSKSSLSIMSKLASKKVDEDDLRTILSLFNVSFSDMF
ncbi:hypothetical protein NEAUS03_1040 [Nematocida ausubeli]|nr:hypothetical protein NEAUS03_1040 [Nematocida ausubeli]